MKVKTLATAFTLSLPLVFGGAYAQTTTTSESGNNRSAAGGAVATNPTPGAGTSVAPGTDASGTGMGTGRVGTAEENTPNAANAATEGKTGANSSTSANDRSGATGTAGTTGATDAAGAMDRATPNANAPGMETRSDPTTASTEAITGWSAKDDLMGKSVFNENDEKIGDVNDVVIASDNRSMYLLIGAGGFLGMGEKNVAVPFDRFERRDDRIMLSGYSKEQLKALPEVRTQR